MSQIFKVTKRYRVSIYFGDSEDGRRSVVYVMDKVTAENLIDILTEQYPKDIHGMHVDVINEGVRDFRENFKL